MKKTAVAIICNGNKLLFLQRDDIPSISNPNKWQFPGGHIEKGESPQEAMKRELLEEVSYVPKLKHIGFVRTFFSETHVFWSYVNSKEAEKFKIGEGKQIKFVSLKNATKLNLTKSVRFYLGNFGPLIAKHIDEKSVPSKEEIGKVNWLKILLFELLQN